MPPPEPGMRATRARSAEGARLPSPGQEVFPWWGLVSPAPSPAGGLQGQLFHLHVGPDKPQREPASAFPGGSAGPSAQGRRVRCSKALCSGACLWPAAPSRAPVARALGFLVTCAGHSWAPHPRGIPAPPYSPTLPLPALRCPGGQAHMLASQRGRGRRGPRGVGMQPAQDLWGTDHHPSPVQPADLQGAPLPSCIPRSHDAPECAA